MVLSNTSVDEYENMNEGHYIQDDEKKRKNRKYGRPREV